MNKDICEITAIHPQKIEDVQRHLLKDKDLMQLSTLFKVISDPTRIRILYALDRQQLCVCDIAVILNMSQSAISHQLKLLKMSHLVVPKRQGKAVFYQLADEHVKKIFNQALDHVMEDM
jgi:DNA-binding transcriptional ArsR family regulator